MIYCALIFKHESLMPAACCFYIKSDFRGKHKPNSKKANEHH